MSCFDKRIKTKLSLPKRAFGRPVFFVFAKISGIIVTKGGFTLSNKGREESKRGKGGTGLQLIGQQGVLILLADPVGFPNLLDGLVLHKF